MTRYGLERFLYRLSISPARDHYLKGALLFDLWFDLPHRPTRDADFLGFGPVDRDALDRHVRDVCVVAVEDGMVFDPESVSIDAIRENAKYGGLRVALVGRLGKARCPVQLDVGYGDAVTPGPEEIAYPTLLEDLPPPKLKVYPRAKAAAVVQCGAREHHGAHDAQQQSKGRRSPASRSSPRGTRKGLPGSLPAWRR